MALEDYLRSLGIERGKAFNPNAVAQNWGSNALAPAPMPVQQIQPAFTQSPLQQINQMDAAAQIAADQAARAAAEEQARVDREAQAAAQQLAQMPMANPVMQVQNVNPNAIGNTALAPVQPFADTAQVQDAVKQQAIDAEVQRDIVQGRQPLSRDEYNKLYDSTATVRQNPLDSAELFRAERRLGASNPSGVSQENSNDNGRNLLTAAMENTTKTGMYAQDADSQQIQAAAMGEGLGQIQNIMQPFKDENGNPVQITQNPGAGFVNLLGGLLPGMAQVVPNAQGAVLSAKQGYGYAVDDSGNIVPVSRTENEQIAQLQSSALDVAGMAPGLKAAGKGVEATIDAISGAVGRTGRQAAKDTLRNTLRSAAPESATEVMQTNLDSIVNRSQDQTTLEDFTNAAIGGAVGGGVFGGVPTAIGGALEARNTRRAARQAEALDATAPDAGVDAVSPVSAMDTSQMAATLEAPNPRNAPTSDFASVQQAATPLSSMAAPSPETMINPLSTMAAPNPETMVSPITQKTAPDTAQNAPQAPVAPQVGQASTMDSPAALDTNTAALTTLNNTSSAGDVAAQSASGVAPANVVPLRQPQQMPETGQAAETQTAAIPESQQVAIKTPTPPVRTEGQYTPQRKSFTRADDKTANKVITAANQIAQAGNNRTPEMVDALQKAVQTMAPGVQGVSAQYASEIMSAIDRGETFTKPSDVYDFLSGKTIEQAALDMEPQTRNSGGKVVAEFMPDRPTTSKKSDGGDKGSTKPEAGATNPLPRGRTGETRTSAASGREYEAIGNMATKQEMTDYFADMTSAEIRKELRDIVNDPGAYINEAQFRAIQDLNVERKANIPSTLMSGLKGKAAAGTSMAAADLAMARKNRARRLKNGEGTREEFINSVYASLPMKPNGTYLDLSIERQADIETIADQYASTATQIQDIKNQDWESIDPSSMTRDQLAGLEENAIALRDLKTDIQTISFMADNVVLKEIADIQEQSVKKAMSYEFAQNQLRERGVYFHNWVDASLLSSPVGRLFDQLNGWTSAMEAVLPLTKAIDTFVYKTTGQQVGARMGGFKQGASTALNRNINDFHDRKALREGATDRFGRLNDTYKNITTFAVAAGDLPIEALTVGGVQQNYNQKYKDKFDQKRDAPQQYLDLMAELDPDNVHDSYRLRAALNQGLGSDSYGISSPLRASIKKSIGSVDFFQKHPALRDTAGALVDRWLLGFWGTTRRIAARGLSRLSLGAPTFAKWYSRAKSTDVKTERGKLEAAMLLRQAMLDAKTGAEFFAIGGALLAAGTIQLTGAYPDDENERAEWERTGKTPFSVRIGDSYWDVSRLFGPMAFPAFAGMSMGQSMANEEDMDTAIEKMIVDSTRLIWDASGAESILGQTGSVKALTDLFKGFTDGDYGDVAGNLTKLAAAMGGEMAGMVMPATSLSNFMGNMIDPIKRETYDPNVFLQQGKTLVNKGMGRFLLRPELTTGGQATTNTDRLARMMGAMSTDSSSDSEYSKELARLYDVGLSVTPADRRAAPTDPVTGEKIPLTADEQYALDSALGAARANLQEQAVGSKFYKALRTDEEKADYLSKVTSSDTVKAEQNKFLSLQGKSSVPVANPLLTDGIQAADDAATIALLDSMSADQKAVELEKPEVAAKYWGGKYRNGEAAGTLTVEDKDPQNKTGLLYKSKVAEFDLKYKIDPVTKSNYENFSNERFKQAFLSNPKETMKLWKYDAARAGAGVSDGEMVNQTKFAKDISPKLNNADLTSLITYDVMSGDERKAWLDNNKNSYDYWGANYRNLEKRGVLTEKDKDQLHQGDTAKYKMEEARFNYENNVPRDLIANYDAISNTDFKQLVKDDPELAALLWDYDVARTEALVSGNTNWHEKQKYKLAGYGSSGGGGGRGGGGGGSATDGVWKVPTVTALTAKTYKPQGGTKMSESVSMSKTSKNARPIDLSGTVKSTYAPGSGIKTKIASVPEQKTVKYEKSKTRQPAMGEPYMSFLKGQSPQSSFRARRNY